MSERRRFMRFDVVLDALYGLLEKPSSRTKSYISNLSKEGLKLEGGAAMTKGSLVELEMSIPGDNMPIFAFGEVAWAEQADNSKYNAGIKFTKINNHDRVRLLDYVYDKWIKTKRKKKAEVN